MKHLHFLLIMCIIIIAHETNYAQTIICGNTESHGTSRSGCDSWEDYEPSSYTNTPIKTIRITFHIFRNGSQGLQDNSSTRAFIDNVVSLINYFWATQQVYNGSASTTYYQDCRLRVQNVNKYFWDNPTGWNYQHTSNAHRDAVWNYIQSQAIGYMTTSLHIISGNSSNTLRGWTPTISGGNDQIIFAPDFDDKYLAWIGGYNNADDELATLLRHEIGHALDLGHPDIDHGCDDYDYTLHGTNNIMGYSGGSTSISLCQIHRMHHAIWSNYHGIKDYVSTGISASSQISPTITGSTCLNTSGQLYEVTNYPFGAKPNWSATPSSKLNTSSGCGHNAQIASNNSSNTGTGSISFTLNYGGTLKSNSKSFTFSNGITGTVTSGGITTPLSTSHAVSSTTVSANIDAPGATSFTWTKTSGSGSWYTYNNGKSLSLTLSTNGQIT